MPGMEWMLDIVLVILLAATLFHAVRLERALGVLKRDRTALEALVASFNASTRAAEAGVERLHAATDGAGRHIQKQIDIATTLKDDLTFLVQRGEGLADRLDDLVRASRPALANAEQSISRPSYAAPSYAPQAERGPQVARGTREEPKVRSQAERDLLKALRMIR
jgi:Domain of unknown function (DUF6468)